MRSVLVNVMRCEKKKLFLREVFSRAIAALFSTFILSIYFRHAIVFDIFTFLSTRYQAMHIPFDNRRSIFQISKKYVREKELVETERNERTNKPNDCT